VKDLFCRPFWTKAAQSTAIATVRDDDRAGDADGLAAAN
jgi:hypothetical protein